MAVVPHVLLMKLKGVWMNYPKRRNKMKAEIEKILILHGAMDESGAVESLTSLIIKWLESKKITLELLHRKKHIKPLDILLEGRKEGRNQLITELVEEIK
jgi:hypothetical protein